MKHLLPSSQLIHTMYIQYYDMSFDTHVNIDIRTSAIDIWEDFIKIRPELYQLSKTACSCSNVMYIMP